MAPIGVRKGPAGWAHAVPGPGIDGKDPDGRFLLRFRGRFGVAQGSGQAFLVERAVGLEGDRQAAEVVAELSRRRARGIFREIEHGAAEGRNRRVDASGGRRSFVVHLLGIAQAPSRSGARRGQPMSSSTS